MWSKIAKLNAQPRPQTRTADAAGQGRTPLVRQRNHMRKTILLMLLFFVVPWPAECSQLSPWVGRWDWQECWPSLTGDNNCVFYELDIKQQEKNLVIDFDMTGYMANYHKMAQGKITPNKLQIIYSSTREEEGSEDMGGDLFKKGEVLFELVKQKEKVLTRWKKLKPELDEHQNPGVYFKKQEPRRNSPEEK